MNCSYLAVEKLGAAIHKFEVEAVDGETDVQSGSVSACPPEGDGGWNEHRRGSSDVRSAPGRCTDDADIFSAVGVPALNSTQRPRGFRHRRAK